LNHQSGSPGHILLARIVCLCAFLAMSPRAFAAPPANPTAQSPGTVSDPGVTLNTTTPLFTWTAVPGATRYGLYISKAPYGSGNLVYANTNVTGTAITLPSGPLVDGGLFRWQVSAFNGASEESSGSNLLYLQVHLASAVPDIRIAPLTVSFNRQARTPIYVEIDWMENSTHTHKPSQAVIDRIVQTFAAAGYDIHIDLSNAIPHQDLLDISTDDLATSADVQAIKNLNFNHAGDGRYYYSIWGHNFKTSTGLTTSSGIAELPGQLSLVTLGSFSGFTGTFSNQVGTFIHELGHNLGQHHGGSDDANYTPNYLSVMNYLYQLDGLSILTVLGFSHTASGFDSYGYSHGLLPSLNESSLDENFGIGLGRAVDWNCNGAIETNVAKDIQGNSVGWCSASGSRTVISDFDNWTSLSTQIRTATAGAKPPGRTVTCITEEEHRPMAAKIEKLRAEGLLPPDGAEAAPFQTEGDAGRSFLIFNDGTATLDVNGIGLDTATSWIHWEPQAPFSVAPGKSQEVLVFVDLSQVPAGQTTRRLLVRSNDPDESPYPGGVNLVISGLGPAPCYGLVRQHLGSGGDPVATPANSAGCGAGQYNSGEAIGLVASPSAGWHVGSWSGTANNGSTSTSNTLTMPPVGQAVTVNYVQAPPTCYPLTRTHTGSGSDPSASPANSSGCSSGQYTAGASIQVSASPATGWSVESWGGTVNNASTSSTNMVTMLAANQTVTANYVSSPGSGILLVDDDDNNPDVRAYYTAALDALGKSYQIWDTGYSDTEPGNVALQAYKTVLWFTGVSDTGVAGPGPSGEADLSSFLSGSLGRCLVISSQDYHFARGTTSFMTSYLGLGSVINDVAQTSVQGQGSAFTGLGPYALAYPFTNFSDQISPAAGAEVAFSGNQGNAGISRIGPNHRTIYLGFPFEALPTAQARQDVMAAALDYCATVFADVPPKYWARKFIEAIYRAGVTNGCAQNPLSYCPEVVITRGSMAQMLIAAKSGSSYTPPPCTSNPFSDVPVSDPICPWVQELVRRGVTAGCGSGQYCPNNPVTRAQMAVFLLATWHGAGYAPAPCSTSAFSDVPASSPFCPWIKEMVNSGITAGCGGGAFCTESPNTRAQLAVFLATTFHLPLQ
jgi:hypothetical protein